MRWFGVFIAMLIVAGFIVFFLIGLIGLNKQKEDEKQILNLLESAGNYPSDYKFYITPDNDMKLTLVEAEEKFVAHRLHKDQSLEEIAIPFNKIIEAEVTVDDNSVSKVSRGSQLAGAMVGGAVAGGIGAVIGGLSSDKVETKRFRKIALKIKLDDFKSPIFKIDFLPSKTDMGLENVTGFKQDDPKVKEALSNVEIWQSIFEIAIRKAS
ncbi:hypothetical protein BFP46_04345 [Bacillus licheniformis]|nr:hypothetical protein BFP47_12540 [Bacillus licheniformis]OJT69842.1 hypothetical protein BFP46_04345 [Bacillus licheniformis]